MDGKEWGGMEWDGMGQVMTLERGCERLVASTSRRDNARHM